MISNTSGVLMWGPRDRTSVERAQNEPPSSPRHLPGQLRGGGNRAAAWAQQPDRVLRFLGIYRTAANGNKHAPAASYSANLRAIGKWPRGSAAGIMSLIVFLNPDRLRCSAGKCMAASRGTPLPCFDRSADRTARPVSSREGSTHELRVTGSVVGCEGANSHFAVP